MKKYALLTWFLLMGPIGLALPIGNLNEACLYRNGLWRSPYCREPCNPCFTWFEGWSIRTGYYGDFVFNRNLSDVKEENDHPEGRHLEKVAFSINAAYIVVNFSTFCRTIDLFFTFGESNFHTRQNRNVFTGGAEGVESDLWFSPAFAWGVGARCGIFQWKCFTVGLEAQYLSTMPEMDYYVAWNTGAITHFRDKTCHYEEWQVGSGLSYRIQLGSPQFIFSPYAGFKYSRAKFGLNHTFVPDTDSHFGHLVGPKHWGWALGTSFILRQLAGINVEGRWGDEKAFNVTGQVRF